MATDKMGLGNALNAFTAADDAVDAAQAVLTNSQEVLAQKKADRETARKALVAAIGEAPASGEAAGQEA